jgi:hypothetical protein
MKGIFVEKIEPAIAEKDWYYSIVLNKFADLLEPGHYSQKEEWTKCNYTWPRSCVNDFEKKQTVTIYYQVIEGMGEPSLHRAMDVFYHWKPWQPFKPITTSKEKEMQITISQKTLEAKKKQYEVALRVATEMDFYYNQEINDVICSAGNYKATQAQSDYQDLMENLRCKILKLNSLCLAESITLPESDYSELFSAIEIPSIKDLDPDLYTCSTMQAPEVEQSDSEVEQSEEQPEEAEEPEPVDLADSLL